MTTTSFSSAEEQALSILPVISSLLSICGSSVIIASAYKTRTSRRWTTFTRLMIGLSCTDMVFSMTMASYQRIPPYESGQYVPMVLGFLTQFSCAISFYNAYRSLYFMLRHRCRLTDDSITKLVEPWMHTTALLFPLVTALIGAAMDTLSRTRTRSRVLGY